MATAKYLDYAGLEHLIQKLYARGFKGMGLSQENFTSELKAKYDALVAASSVEDLTALFNRVDAIESIIEKDTDGAINKFNEIVDFLADIADDTTLKGILAAKANTADVYNKTDADSKFMTSAQVEAALTPYAKTTDVNTELAKKANATDVNTELAKKADTETMTTELGKKLNASDVTAITNTEIDAMISGE